VSFKYIVAKLLRNKPTGLYFTLKYFFVYFYHTDCLERHLFKMTRFFGPSDEVISWVQVYFWNLWNLTNFKKTSNHVYL